MVLGSQTRAATALLLLLMVSEPHTPPMSLADAALERLADTSTDEAKHHAVDGRNIADLRVLPDPPPRKPRSSLLAGSAGSTPRNILPSLQQHRQQAPPPPLPPPPAGVKEDAWRDIVQRAGDLRPDAWELVGPDALRMRTGMLRQLRRHRAAIAERRRCEADQLKQAAAAAATAVVLDDSTRTGRLERMCQQMVQSINSRAHASKPRRKGRPAAGAGVATRPADGRSKRRSLSRISASSCAGSEVGGQRKRGQVDNSLEKGSLLGRLGSLSTAASALSLGGSTVASSSTPKAAAVSRMQSVTWPVVQAAQAGASERRGMGEEDAGTAAAKEGTIAAAPPAATGGEAAGFQGGADAGDEWYGKGNEAGPQQKGFKGRASSRPRGLFSSKFGSRNLQHLEFTTSQWQESRRLKAKGSKRQGGKSVASEAGTATACRLSMLRSSVSCATASAAAPAASIASAAVRLGKMCACLNNSLCLEPCHQSHKVLPPHLCTTHRWCHAGAEDGPGGLCCTQAGCGSG